MRKISIAVIAFLVFAMQLAAQPAKPDPLKARAEAHRGDFDYLLGDWEFSADSEQYGKFGGRWSAVRLGDGGPILDEYRVTGDKGETYYVTQTLRAYNAYKDRWELVGTDGGNGLQNVGTGQRTKDEMHIEQNFGVGTPNPSTLRIRYYNIATDHFSWIADRSTDGGKTWTKGFQKIEAHRIGPARAIPLTVPQPQPK